MMVTRPEDATRLLSGDGAALAEELLRHPRSGAVMAELPTLLRWALDRAADALAELHAGDWVTISAKGRVQLTEWAVFWFDHRPSKDGKRWVPERWYQFHPLTSEPADGRRAESARHLEALARNLVVLTAGGRVYRELHRPGCPCRACRLPVSATKEAARLSAEGEPCGVCGGAALPSKWYCVADDRWGGDGKTSPAPDQSNRCCRGTPGQRQQAPPGGRAKAARPRRLKGGTGR